MPKRNTRRNHSPRFKFRVALETAKDLKSINEIAAEHKLAPSRSLLGRRSCSRKAALSLNERTLGIENSKQIKNTQTPRNEP